MPNAGSPGTTDASVADFQNALEDVVEGWFDQHGTGWQTRECAALAIGTDFWKASKVPAKKRHVTIKSRVEDLSSLAYERGVLPEDLERLIDLITTPAHLDQASLAAIIKNLYPTGKISDEAILKVIGSLGHGQLKPTLAIQALLLRWLVLVYHALNSQGILSQAYAVLFNLLDTAGIRPQLCHLLALITRRRHVRPYRIQALLSLSRQTGNDPGLTGLLRVFKNYYPEIIVGNLMSGKGSAFKHPDPQWRARLDEIQVAHRQRLERDAQGSHNSFQVKHIDFNSVRGSKTKGIPAVHTSHAQETSVTLEEVDSAESLVQNLEKIELPNQLVAVMADPLLQKVMVLRPGDEAYARADRWITACLSDLTSGDADEASLLEMLEIVRDYATSMKTLPPLFLKLFQVQLRTSKIEPPLRDILLETMSYTPLDDWTDLYPSTFQPLEQSILDNTAESQIELMSFYTLLLRHWATILLAKDDVTARSTPTITRLIEHVNVLSLTLLQTSPSTSTHLKILGFYEQAASIISNPDLLRHVHVTVPSPLLVYILHFSQSPAVVSRICGVLALYKQALEKAMTQATKRQLTVHERQHINTFNGFLMDICNCVWRGKAFGKTDENAQGCRVPQSMIPTLTDYLSALDSDLALSTLFMISYSPVLSLQSISYVRVLEDAELENGDNELQARHAGPVTQSSLIQLSRRGGLVLTWQEYRSGVLRHLSDQGLGGIPELMYNTMKNLRDSRAGH